MGAKDAENIIILMGSATEAARVGYRLLDVQGRRRFPNLYDSLYTSIVHSPVKHLLAAVPKSTLKHVSLFLTVLRNQTA